MLLVMSACRRTMAMGIKYSSKGARSLCTLVGARLQNINVLFNGFHTDEWESVG